MSCRWVTRKLYGLRLPCKHFCFTRPIASFILLSMVVLFIQFLTMASWDDTPSHLRDGSRSAKSGINQGGVQHAKRGVGRMLGVQPSHQSKYVADSQGQFWCLDSKHALPFSRVNDNYCDCEDGSDEPSTSACPTGSFYCSASNIMIVSSRVNDGVCDCCDGSDEYLATHLLDRPNKERQKVIERYLPPCPNTCVKT